MTDTTEQAPKLVTVTLKKDQRQKVRGVQYVGGEEIIVPEHTGKKLEARELGKITGTVEADDELAGVAFASPAAEKAARAADLRAAHFTEIEPAGETGYTAEQVRTLVDG